MSYSAALRLAQLRCQFFPDDAGRAMAGKKVVEELIEAVKVADLVLETTAKIHRLRLSPAATVSVEVSTTDGEVSLGAGAEPIEEWEYDPIKKEYRGMDGRDAVDILADHVGSHLNMKHRAESDQR
jgi:hypothetical protein